MLFRLHRARMGPPVVAPPLLRLLALSVVLAIPAGSGPARAARSAEIVFRGGIIHTLNESAPTASALAVSGGRIVYVGDDAGAGPWVGKKTRLVDLAGRAMVPGFVDADAHLLEVARMAEGIDLYGTTSFAEVTRRVAQAARRVQPNAWVLGWGWDRESWRDSGPIRLVELQASSGVRPVVLFHATDDVIMANVGALAAASVPEDLPDPPGGRVGRDMGGVRTGDLLGEAASLVTRALPIPSQEDYRAWYAAAAESCLARGVTLAHDAGVPTAARRAIEALYGDDKTRPSLELSLSLKPEPLEFEPILAAPPSGSDATPGLTINSVTFRLDGAVNSRGAALTHMYYDAPGYRGYHRYGSAELIVAVERARAAGWRPVFEAHGDSALSLALESLENHSPDAGGPPPILAGLDLVRPDQFDRIKASGAAAIVTATHLIDGSRWMDNRIGPDAPERPWSLGSLSRAGVPIALGTGAPFAAGRPILAFFGAVQRQDMRGRPEAGWRPEERLTREAALRALTLDGARILGRDADTGSLTVGKRADLVVLSGDLMMVPERAIPALKVEMTVAGGRIVHDSTPALRN